MPRIFTLTACWLVFAATVAFGSAPLVHPNDRIIFAGDSITGQGGNGGDRGWVGLIGSGLKSAMPDANPTLVALGGSGQTVGSWLNIERKSREAAQFLDVKKFDVQAELAQPADVLVIMLGMNDVLSPRQVDSPEGYAKFVEQYRELIGKLRERVHPRVLAIATPTPCTEDPEGPKNVVMDKMVAVLSKLAEEENCVLLPTRAAAWEVLHAGRKLNPEFHITADQVHPNSAGHLAIAAGMLRGLGFEEQAAGFIADATVKTKSPNGLSHEVSILDNGELLSAPHFRIRVYHATGAAQLDLPKGWKLTNYSRIKDGSEFVVQTTGELELVSHLDARVGDAVENIEIPAPWLVGTGNVGWLGWRSGVYDPATGRLPADEIVRTGQGLGGSLKGMELKPGAPVQWRTYVASVNFGGGANPNALDFAGIAYFTGGEVGYGLRWVRSDTERTVNVEVTRMGFAGSTHMELWANGETVYLGDVAKAKEQELTLTLKRGWNRISFKSNFQQWQWQFRIDLKPIEGDALDDLRYSTIPH